MYYDQIVSLPYNVESVNQEVVFVDSLVVNVDPYHGLPYWEYSITTESDTDTISVLQGDGWNAYPVVNDVSGAKYIELLAAVDDSSFVSDNVNMLELPTTREMAVGNGVAIRYKFQHLGTDRSGVVLQLHNGTGTTTGDGWLFQVRSDDKLDLFRVVSGSANSIKTSTNTVFTDGVEQEFIAQIVGDSLLNFYEVESDGSLTQHLNYTAALSKRFPGERAVGISSNWANSGTDSYWRDLSVYAPDQDPNTIPSNEETFKLTFANSGNITAEEIAPNFVRLGINMRAGVFKSGKLTAEDASLLIAEDGDFIYITSTNATFTSVGFWGYENGAWVKL